MIPTMMRIIVTVNHEPREKEKNNDTAAPISSAQIKIFVPLKEDFQP